MVACLAPIRPTAAYFTITFWEGRLNDPFGEEGYETRVLLFLVSLYFHSTIAMPKMSHSLFGIFCWQKLILQSKSFWPSDRN